MGEEEIQEVIVGDDFQGLIGSTSDMLNEALQGTGGLDLMQRLHSQDEENYDSVNLEDLSAADAPEDSDEYRQVSMKPVESFLSDLAIKFAKKYRLSDRFGDLAHRYLGIDPETGKVIGSLAGNLIFGTGGKDNVLDQIGKVVLDKIVTGKWKRKVRPFQPPRADDLPPSPDDRPETDYEGGGVEGLFHQLRDRCLQEQTLYEDPDFRADDSSLTFSGIAPYGIEWKRPTELVENPQLFVAGHSRFDVRQGKLGNCWMLAAVASLTMQDELFYRVVPPDQSFTDNYADVTDIKDF